MTIQEFHRNFDIELDKSMDFEYPYILPEIKDYWLNKAQEVVIEEIAYPKDPNKPGFEQDQKRIDYLSAIVKKSPVIVPTTEGSDFIAALPVDYDHLVRHRCTTVSGCGTKTVGGQLAKYEFLNQMWKDPFWEPIADEPYYYFRGNSLVYETKGNFSISQVFLDYIKRPAQMRLGSEYVNPTTDIQCELDSRVHSLILSTAVSMVLENIESQRYQTNLNELNKVE